MEHSAQIRSVGDTPVIDLQGRITLGESSARLREAAEQLFAEGKSRILLNMSGVPYIDSAGLGAIASCHVKARSAGGGVGLFEVSERVRDLLELTKLSEKVPVFADEKAALASIARL